MGRSAGFKAISDAIGAIYDAGYQPSLWSEAVARIQAMMHGSTACITRLDLEDPSNFTFVAPGRDPEWNWDLRHLPLDALINQRKAAGVGTVYSDDQIYGRRPFRRSRIWNEWFAPQDMYGGIGCNLLVSDRAFWFFDIQRGRRQNGFDDRDRKVLALLAPHLRRAHLVGGQFERILSAPSFLADAPFATFVLDHRMTIVAMNLAAHALLMRSNGALTARGDVLVVVDATREAAVRHAVAQVCGLVEELPGTGADLLVRSPVGRLLMLSIAPLSRSGARELRSRQPVALVTVREGLPGEALDLDRYLRERFGLTAKEAALARLLAQGAPLKAIAEQQQITLATARTHLSRIFRKTHTARQSELALLLNKLPGLA